MAENPGTAQLDIPQGPLDRVLAPVVRFMHIEAASGFVLLAATIAALSLANSPVAGHVEAFWHTPIGIEIGGFHLRHSLVSWINDGLMVIFFFVTGLEVKRELVLGELRDMRRASLPIAGAIGGMLVPAATFLALMWGQPGQHGWGIPMATDIAFVVGAMAILGSRVPYGLRIMLLSLAIADDIGAILVIAVGYSGDIHWWWLVAGFAGIGLVIGLRELGVRNFLTYILMGMFIWLGFHESGIHATLVGVILGMLTPVRSKVDPGLFQKFMDQARETLLDDWEEAPHRARRIWTFRRAARETVSPQEYLENSLHPWVAFVIMPLFALANAGVPIRMADVTSPLALAVTLGLVLGKPLGILAFSFLAVKVGLARLPAGVNWGMVAGGGLLCGIGFTMALFIAGLAVNESLLSAAKIGVLSGSMLSAVAGMTLLLLVTRPKKVMEAPAEDST